MNTSDYTLTTGDLHKILDILTENGKINDWPLDEKRNERMLLVNKLQELLYNRKVC